MIWTQVYDPLGSPWLSTLCAALPVVALLGSPGRSGRLGPRSGAEGRLGHLLAVLAVPRAPSWPLLTPTRP